MEEDHWNPGEVRVRSVRDTREQRGAGAADGRTTRSLVARTHPAIDGGVASSLNRIARSPWVDGGRVQKLTRSPSDTPVPVRREADDIGAR